MKKLITILLAMAMVVTLLPTMAFGAITTPVDIATCDVSLSLTETTYNGQAQTPTVTVKQGTEIVDASYYTVAYSDNVNFGTGKVTVTGNTANNAKGTKEVTFNIKKLEVKSSDVNVTPVKVGTVPTAKEVKITVNGGVIPASEYTITAATPTTNSDNNTMKIEFKGTNITGTVEKTFSSRYSIADCVVTPNNDRTLVYSYDGKEHFSKSGVDVSLPGGVKLGNGDFDVTYSGNVYAYDTPRVKITAKNGSSVVANFDGSGKEVVAGFRISRNLSECTTNMEIVNGVLALVVRDGGRVLTLNTDYSATTTNGMTTIYGKGSTSTGGYYGSKAVSGSQGFDLGKATILYSGSSTGNYPYTGYAVNPSITIKDGVTELRRNTDYYYTEPNNSKVGTYSFVIYGMGRYANTRITATYSIGMQNNFNLANTTVTLSQMNYTADGFAKQPVVVVKNGNAVLLPGIDYVVAYKDNTAPGTASVILTGKGKYVNTTKTVNFTITGLTQTMNVGEENYTTYLNYRPIRISPTATGDGTGFSFTSSDSSVVTVSNLGEVKVVGTGLATITVTTVGVKKYSPVSKTVVIKVKPRKPVFSLSKGESGSAAVTITKVSGATKYQIRYGRSGYYRRAYSTQINDGSLTQTRDLNNLRSGKSYYVKVRAYKTMDNGTKVWGNWTSTKRVRV